jgi:hypothetical protein
MEPVILPAVPLMIARRYFMKAAAIFTLALAVASLTACAYPDPNATDAGNPNHFAYAGAPGSVYDVAANPPKDMGQVAYNPNQPLEVNLPSNDPASASRSTTPEMAPVTATPPNPVH